MSSLIYLDNAATTYPKPRSVYDAVRSAMINAGGNPGRGTHSLSLSATELLYDTRIAAAELFNSSPDRVVFTMNATQSLNYAIKGLAERGGHILIDNFSHNAVYRPAAALSNSGNCTFDVYDASGDTAKTILDIKRKLRANTRIIVATHQSNITSKTLPINEIGELCKKYGISFVVDASQSAGHIPINIKEMNITSLCMPGHKGLFGPMGVGLLISGENVKYNTLIEGGAGIASLESRMPQDLPERLEAGTLPLPALGGLLAGIRWVREIGEDKIHSYETMLSEIFAREVAKLDRVKLYGNSNGAVVSFNVENFSPSKVGEILSSRGICVRTGYHCAPLAHKTVGSFEEGSVRLGISYMNRPSDIYAVIEVLRELNSKM